MDMAACYATGWLQTGDRDRVVRNRRRKFAWPIGVGDICGHSPITALQMGPFTIQEAVVCVEERGPDSTSRAMLNLVYVLHDPLCISISPIANGLLCIAQ